MIEREDSAPTVGFHGNPSARRSRPRLARHWPRAIGELRRGIERLPESRKRRKLEAWLGVDLARRFAGRILPIDESAAEHWGIARARAEAAGARLPVIEGLLGATALARGMTLVTRNMRHIAGGGAALLDPWES